MLLIKLILSIMCLFLIYVFAVLIVKHINRVDTVTARRTVLKFVKDCMYSTPSQTDVVTYPIFIGIDENGFPHADIIEYEFKTLNTIFRTFYLYNFFNNTNLLCYAFKVDNCINEISEDSLVNYCEKECENIVHRYIHRNYPNIGHVDNIVAVHFQESILTVFIAKNPNGIKENVDRKMKIRRFYQSENIGNLKSISESWDDRQ